MSEKPIDVVVIGGGVVGLGLGIALLRKRPELRVVVLEAETQLALHGSGRNSGVLHAGFYYSPDSLKAQLTRRGNEMLRQLCHDENVPLRECGKVVVTRNAEENLRLEDLYSRAIANGVEVHLIDTGELKKYEPLAQTHEMALWSPNTAVASPAGVTEMMARVFTRLGGELMFGHKVASIRDNEVIFVNQNKMTARHVVNAAGLYADKLAHSTGVGSNYTILPFKGLYLYGNDDAPKLTRHVYPVPDPRNPFLGVHLTLTVDGKTKIGPTAIPAFSRLNYSKLGNIKINELWPIATTLPKFLLSKHHDGFGLIKSEIPKYLRRVIVKKAEELVPSVKADQYQTWGKSGIRAQLFNLSEKRLEMDFVVESANNQTHILNAVSPAWTGSLSFGEYVADQVLLQL
jgi:(S)-2-hydroxyglutarate dehydrogenase